MKLPSTREEFTVWALEHTTNDTRNCYGIKFICSQLGLDISQASTLNRISHTPEYKELFTQFIEWMDSTVDEQPSLVSYYTERKYMYIYFANVFITRIDLTCPQWVKYGIANKIFKVGQERNHA